MELTPSPRKDHLIGTQVGEYVIEERVGIGGMGVVYRAKQPRIGREVAIKVLRAEVMEDPREMERFLDEARAVSAINHRGIISIFGAGELADGRQYLVMEYLKGEALDARLRREGKIPPAEVIPILEEITSALQGVHNAGIVHRDLKPGNVFLVQQDDGKPWVKLLDFGLARRGERTDVSRIAGTPDYLSPEHSRGLAASPPSDMYSLGVMAFQLLTGRLPFSGRTPLEVMEKHVYDEPPNLLALEPSMPEALSQLVMGLLKKEPEARPQIIQIKALLKQASQQARSASTQPGESAISPAELIQARANAGTDPANTPLEIAGMPPRKATDELFEGLPRAISGTRPTADSGDQGTPTPGKRPSPAQVERVQKIERNATRFAFMGIGAIAALLLAWLVLARMMEPAAENNERRTRSIKPREAPGMVEMPNHIPREDDEPMPENPAATPQLPDGGY
jgi:eukaryotic-like serine/threonine-protein kinase